MQSLSSRSMDKMNFPACIVGKTFRNHQKYDVTYHKSEDGNITCSYEQYGIPLGKNLPLIISNSLPKSQMIKMHPYLVTLISKDIGFVLGTYGLKGGGTGGSKPLPNSEDHLEKSESPKASTLSKPHHLTVRDLSLELEKNRRTKDSGAVLPIKRAHFTTFEDAFNNSEFSKHFEITTNVFEKKDKDFFSHKRTPFICIKIDKEISGQWVFCARVETMARDFSSLIDSINRVFSTCVSIHLNTGTHGTPDGRNASIDSSLIFQDDSDFSEFAKHKNGSVLQVEENSPPNYPQGANFIINSFCFSSEVYKHPKGAPDCFKNLMEKVYQIPPTDRETERMEELLNYSDKNKDLYNSIIREGNFSPLQSCLVQSRFGKAKWEEYFGDVGVEPPLPSNIEEILNRPCPFWPEKKVRDTHLLVLIPETVNGKPFHLDSLSELIQSPKKGYKTEYRYYSDWIKEALGTKSLESHWVLMTNDVIPGSRYKPYEEQKVLVQKRAKESGIPYELPRALEAATVILMHHVETGQRIYSDSPWTWTRCQEKMNDNQWPVVIGGFAAGGLGVYDSYWIAGYYGVGGLWNVPHQDIGT